MFPSTIGRFILDAVVDTERGNYDANLDHNYELDILFDLFLSWLAGQYNYYKLGTTKEENANIWSQIHSDLQNSPALGIVGSAKWDNMTYNFASDQFSWEFGAELMKLWTETIMADAFGGCIWRVRI